MFVLQKCNVNAGIRDGSNKLAEDLVPLSQSKLKKKVRLCMCLNYSAVQKHVMLADNEAAMSADVQNIPQANSLFTRSACTFGYSTTTTPSV